MEQVSSSFGVQIARRPTQSFTRILTDRVHVMKIEGEVSKRYGLSYGGDTIGSYETAKEAGSAYENYEKLIRPMTDPKKKFRYSIHDGRVKGNQTGRFAEGGCGKSKVIGEKHLASMTDPTDALVSFQQALLDGEIRLQRGELDPDIFV
jgi:hypothetical protein